MPCDVRKRPGQARLCLLQRAAKVEAGEGDDVVTLTYLPRVNDWLIDWLIDYEQGDYGGPDSPGDQSTNQ